MDNKEIKTYGDLATEISYLDFIIARTNKLGFQNIDYINALQELTERYGYTTVAKIRCFLSKIYLYQNELLAFSRGATRREEAHFIPAKFEKALNKLNAIKVEFDKELE